MINSVPGVVTRHRNKNEEKAELLNHEHEIGGSNRSTPQPGSSNTIIKQEIKEEKDADDARCVIFSLFFLDASSLSLFLSFCLNFLM